jgi:hypothetical protein
LPPLHAARPTKSTICSLTRTATVILGQGAARVIGIGRAKTPTLEIVLQARIGGPELRARCFADEGMQIFLYRGNVFPFSRLDDSGRTMRERISRFPCSFPVSGPTAPVKSSGSIREKPASILGFSTIAVLVEGLNHFYPCILPCY